MRGVRADDDDEMAGGRTRNGARAARSGERRARTGDRRDRDSDRTDRGGNDGEDDMVAEATPEDGARFWILSPHHCTKILYHSVARSYPYHTTLTLTAQRGSRSIR